MKIVRNLLGKGAIIWELMGFLWQHKLWWLIPLVLVEIVLGLLIIFGQATGTAPFLYPLF